MQSNLDYIPDQPIRWVHNVETFLGSDPKLAIVGTAISIFQDVAVGAMRGWVLESALS
jgi:hypothetical protein